MNPYGGLGGGKGKQTLLLDFLHREWGLKKKWGLGMGVERGEGGGGGHVVLGHDDHEVLGWI